MLTYNQHQAQDRVASRIAAGLAGRTQLQISAYLSDQYARVKLENGDMQILALDHIARLVTALRAQGIWPLSTGGRR